jgi:hypothetical protein
VDPAAAVVVDQGAEGGGEGEASDVVAVARGNAGEAGGTR